MLSLPICELDVQALIDSNLTSEEEKQVWQGIYSNPALEGYYRQMLGQKRLLISWWNNGGDERVD